MASPRIKGEAPVDGALAPGISELRANLLIGLADSDRPSVAVTSPHEQENGRRVAAHLATALAQTGRRVLLVDADVTPGTSVADQPSLDTLSPDLTVLTADAVVKGDAALLVAAPFLRELDSRRADYDIVIVACSPLLEVPETRTVAAACSGALLVVTDGQSRRDDAVRAAAILRSAGVRTLGAVVQSSA